MCPVTVSGFLCCYGGQLLLWKANSDYQRMMGRFQNVGTKAAEAARFIRPEIMAIDDAKLEEIAQPLRKSGYGEYLRQLLTNPVQS